MYSYISNPTQMFKNDLIISLKCESRPMWLDERTNQRGQWVVLRGLASLVIALHPVKLNEMARWMDVGRRSNLPSSTDWIQLFVPESGDVIASLNAAAGPKCQNAAVRSGNTWAKISFSQIFIWPISYKLLKSRQILLIPLNFSKSSSISYNVESVHVCLNLVLRWNNHKNTTHSKSVFLGVYLCRPKRSACAERIGNIASEMKFLTQVKELESQISITVDELKK